MEEKQIQKIMTILSEWNPLKDRAANIPDLDGYRTEAIDILCLIHSRSSETNVLNTVRTILNEAFGLALNKDECIEAAKQILMIAKEERL